MHHQDRHGDLLQVFGEVRLGKGDDAVIMRLGASHHALAPPIPDHPVRGFRTRPVITIERSSRHIVIELGSVGGELRLKPVKNLLGQPARISRRLHHQRWHRTNDHYTSAGATSGIDLCLALVEEDHGNKLALDVARAMVMFLYRPGNQAQFSVLLSAESAVSPSIRKLQTWLPEHLAEDLSVPALARRAGMSPRTFQRVFTEEVGKGPSLHVEELRIEAVRRKLELTSVSGIGA